MSSIAQSAPVLAPIFLGFEIWQLVVAERYTGIKQIARSVDPRLLGLSEVSAFAWTAAIFLYWAWTALLLFSRVGRGYGLALIAVFVVGYTVRRGSPLKWILVILTFEGAVRVGLLIALTATYGWHR